FRLKGCDEDQAATPIATTFGDCAMDLETGLETFVNELRQDGVALWVEDSRLKYRAKRGTLDQQRQKRITQESRQIADLLKNGVDASAGVQKYEAQPRRIAPLSFAQERLWLLDQLGVIGAAYLESSAARIIGSLDLAALTWSLRKLVERHEILRTRFMIIGDKPMQVVESGTEFDLL